MLNSSHTIKQLDNCEPQAIPEWVFNSVEPVLLKAMVADWPIVDAGLQSSAVAALYIQKFDRGGPVVVYQGAPEIEGRIFYSDDFNGFNFARTRQTLSEVFDKLLDTAADPKSSYYVGSTMVDHWLPGFRDENDINLGDRESLVSIWLGNQSRIAAHYDFPNNIACSVVGRRRFTLFPPDQIDNLYVGPIDFTPSGQAISLVDHSNPDFDKFPKYRQALAAAYTVELEPGDALMIPSMWWHHVESLDALNVLINYWWRSTPSYQGSPANALQHAVMSIRDLPAEQRSIWKEIFERYVFDDDQSAFEHIPEHARGVLSGVDEHTATAIRAQLVKFLK